MIDTDVNMVNDKLHWPGGSDVIKLYLMNQTQEYCDLRPQLMKYMYILIIKNIKHTLMI